MARSDSEGHEDDGISPITPVRISVLEPTQPLQESEPEQVPDIKIGRDCHEEEDLEAYMDRAAEARCCASSTINSRILPMQVSAQLSIFTAGIQAA